jgi:hypothetical protein
METNPNYELLKQAYAIIDGIPETAIALGSIRTKEGATLAEGTVCSPEGWLALHPTFNEHGLTMSADGKELRFNGEADSGSHAAFLMAKVFGLRPEKSEQLFGDRQLFTDGDDSGLSDKRLWQRRIREYLQGKGQLGGAVSQAENACTVDVQVAETGPEVTALVDDASKHAASGADNAMAIMKFAIDSTNAGYQLVAETTAQTVKAMETSMDAAMNYLSPSTEQTARTDDRRHTRKH